MTLDRGRLFDLCTRLRQAEQPIRILRTISWPGEVRERFFASGCEELPRVAYDAPDITSTLEILDDLRPRLGDDPVDRWLWRQARSIELSARMLAAVGTADFGRFSIELYGSPSDPSLDGKSTVLELARHLDAGMHELEHIDLGAPPAACHLAFTVAQAMETAVGEAFGTDAPLIEIVEELSSNALAGPRRIRVRRTACFTDRDVQQLIHHEAFIHVATSLNGRYQEDLPILAAGHGGTTRTQEGLAVFAELISGTLDTDRLHRLARRVLAIQMALDGADFLDIYRYFIEEGVDQEQAFESTRRVFRGGVLTGGAPFTKDGVYLDGLLRVHSFLRTLVAEGRTDALRLLFCGKLDLEDVPVLGTLVREGLCRPARYLPPWASDLRFLVAYLSFSTFLNQVDLAAVRQNYRRLLAETPRIDGEAVRPPAH